MVVLIANILKKIGSKFLSIFQMVGNFSFFLGRFFFSLFKNFSWRNFYTQLFDIQYLSIPLISLTGFFTGAVFALQSYNGLERFGAGSSVPVIVILSLARELGPVLSGLMVVSRVGSRIAAELGGMSVSKQISAMNFMGISPYSFVIAPRILACIIAMPFLSLIFTIMGFLGNYLVCMLQFHMSSVSIIRSSIDVLTFQDVFSGLFKAAIFGLVIGSISSFFGMKAKGGSFSIGSVTTKAVVSSSIFMLFMNYIITSLLYN